MIIFIILEYEFIFCSTSNVISHNHLYYESTYFCILLRKYMLPKPNIVNINAILMLHDTRIFSY